MGGSLIAKQMKSHFRCRGFSFLQDFSNVVIKRNKHNYEAKHQERGFSLGDDIRQYLPLRIS